MEVHWSRRGYDWFLERHRGEVGATELTGANYLVAISLRNPAFSNAWLQAVRNEVKHFSGSLAVCLVDTPYIGSLAAQLSDRKKLEEQLANLKLQREQQKRRISEIFVGNSKNQLILEWDDIAKIVPNEIRDEVVTAFFEKKRARELILAQVLKVFPDENCNERIERLSRFFVEEIPTLIYIYYVLLPGCIDVYPGPQADFFWALDCGELFDELPVCSSIVQLGPSHTYLRVLKI